MYRRLTTPNGIGALLQSLIETLYTDLSFRIKVNGQVGDKMAQRNGVRQGCGCSPLVYVLQQEALMIAIREDPELRGVAYTSRGGDWLDKQMRERAMSDDTVVYLEGEEYLPRLFHLFEIHGVVTGQQMNRSKSCIITFDGKEGEEGEELERVRFGQDDIDPGLGIVPGTEEQVMAQWEKQHEEVRREAVAGLDKVRETYSDTAKVTMVKSAFASKLPYRNAIQVPKAADAARLRNHKKHSTKQRSGSLDLYRRRRHSRTTRTGD